MGVLGRVARSSHVELGLVKGNWPELKIARVIKEEVSGSGSKLRGRFLQSVRLFLLSVCLLLFSPGQR